MSSDANDITERGDSIGSGNFIIDNLNSALSTWNDRMAEIWTLVSTSPENFRDGGIWNTMFLGYSDLLNALDTGATTKITIHNRHINAKSFAAANLLRSKEDGMDGHRQEYNWMLLDKAVGASSSVEQERYLTISVHKKNVEEARTFYDLDHLWQDAQRVVIEGVTED